MLQAMGSLGEFYDAISGALEASIAQEREACARMAEQRGDATLAACIRERGLRLPDIGQHPKRAEGER